MHAIANSLVHACVMPKGPFRPRASTRVDAAYLQVMYALSNVCMYPAVNYVIFSYVIALSMTSLVQVLSGVWHEHFDHLKQQI